MILKQITNRKILHAKIKKEGLVIARMTNLKFLKMKTLKSIKEYNIKKAFLKKYCILNHSKEDQLKPKRERKLLVRMKIFQECHIDNFFIKNLLTLYFITIYYYFY